MKIGIIGPSKLENLEKINPDSKKILHVLAKEIAKKRKEIVVTPDKASVSEYFAKKYLEFGGKKVFEIIPFDDKEFGYDYINTELGEKINCGTWRNQPEKLNEETDVLLCVGYAAGVLIEIAYSKWFKPKKVYIIKELISEKLPKEIDLGLDYISFKEFKERLK